MIIVNINSRFDLSPDQISFIEEILTCDIFHHQKEFWLYELTKKIPIYLVDEAKFDNIKKGNYSDNEEHRNKFNNERNNKEGTKYSPETELLGFYLSKGALGNQEIYICTDTIFRHTKNNDELKYLLAKVIVHEFAHAYMDYRHRRYNKTDEFYSWMEESFANEMTLYHFRDYERIPNHRKYKRRYLSHDPIPSPFDYVVEFIKKQPANYKLGLDLFEHGIRCFDIWARDKCEVEQKTTAKKEWLDYVKANVRSSTFDHDKLRELTNNVIREDHYGEVTRK